ncbi:hypothetical protein HMPREF3214_01474 [Alloscardovia omnicolens]|nr:hypothetical protein HMPREF3214_01474 [Alloscardovia omnicolens]
MLPKIIKRTKSTTPLHLHDDEGAHRYILTGVQLQKEGEKLHTPLAHNDCARL